jgi:hypothetical protein
MRIKCRIVILKTTHNHYNTMLSGSANISNKRIYTLVNTSIRPFWQGERIKVGHPWRMQVQNTQGYYLPNAIVRAVSFAG